MNLEEKVDSRLVSFGFPGTTKDEVLEGVARLMYDAGKVSNYDQYLKGIYQREDEFTTGMGFGIAIPHCKDDCVNTAAFTLVKLNNEIEWASLDDKPVKYVIMLAAPNTSENIHLDMLAQLSASLMDEDFRDGLMNAKNIDDIKETLKRTKE